MVCNREEDDTSEEEEEERDWPRMRVENENRKDREKKKLRQWLSSAVQVSMQGRN